MDGGRPLEDTEPSAAARRRHLESTGNASPALPFGVTLLGPAWSDDFLWDIAAAYQVSTCPAHSNSWPETCVLISLCV